MPRFAANLTMMFTDVPFVERFDRAARAGFKAVEFLWPYEIEKNELKAILKDTKLEVALFNTKAGDTSKGRWGHAGLVGFEKEAKEDFDLALDYATTIGCKTVHVMSCVVPHPNEKEICKRTFVNNMHIASDMFIKHNINLTMEALCPDIKPNYLYHSQYETLALMREINRPNVFIQLDTFHAQMVDGNLSYLIKNFKDCYAHVQVASAPMRHEVDEGEINYEYIFKLFDEVGYKGFIGLEYNPRGNTEDGLGFIKPYL